MADTVKVRYFQDPEQKLGPYEQEFGTQEIAELFAAEVGGEIVEDAPEQPAEPVTIGTPHDEPTPEQVGEPTPVVPDGSAPASDDASTQAPA